MTQGPQGKCINALHQKKRGYKKVVKNRNASGAVRVQHSVQIRCVKNYIHGGLQRDES